MWTTETLPELGDSPPLVVCAEPFVWELARVGQRFTRFLEDGRPTRARLSVTFNEFIDEEREAKEVNRQTADFTREHVVQDGETVSSIAFKHYEDPRLWRPIALANGLDDPRSIVRGQLLRVPSLPSGGSG